MDRSIKASRIQVAYHTDGEPLKALKETSFTLREGRSLGVVGESGSGKTSLALALMGLVNRPHQTAGELMLFGKSYLNLREVEKKTYRWSTMAMMFQNATEVLNPVMVIGSQLTERLIEKRLTSSRLAREEAERLLRLVGLEGWETDAYPHQLSGGMQQRVLLAMAIACNPRFLILDEPTSSLDGIARQEMIQIIKSLQKKLGFAMLVISHDLKLVGELTQEIMVMYGGRIVEKGLTDAVFEKPMHPYTCGFMNASVEMAPHKDLWGIPGEYKSEDTTAGCIFRDRCTQSLDCCQSETPALKGVSIEREVACHQDGLVSILKAESVSKEYQIGSRKISALNTVYMNLRHGETLALIGPSGSGKSTFAKIVAGFLMPDAGEIFYRGTPLTDNRFACREGGIQLVLQDPFSALSHRLTVEEAVGEPLRINNIASEEEIVSRIKETLKSLQLYSCDAFLQRYTSCLSGGQRQRVALARALVMRPKVLIADEITSMLDVSTQANVLRLLKQLQNNLGFALLLITHDLNLARKVSDQLIVMEDGKILEEGNATRILQNADQSRSAELLKAGLVDG